MPRGSKGRMAKQKGARFENQNCKAFGEWWGEPFKRTPGSGGSTVKDTHDLAGDVVCKDKTFPFHIECKHQENWWLYQMFVSDVCGPWKWWQQAFDECPDRRVPLLVMTRNHHPVFAVMDADQFFIVFDDDHRINFVILEDVFDDTGNSEVAVFLRDELFELEPDFIRKVFKKRRRL